MTYPYDDQQGTGGVPSQGDPYQPYPPQAPGYPPPANLPVPSSGPSAYYPPPQGYPSMPMTGIPQMDGYSDKSKMTAGLLQLLLGGLLTLGGIGRLYAGQKSMGTIQLVVSGCLWLLGICGIIAEFVTFGWATLVTWMIGIVWCPIWVWFVVDGILMLTGQPRDGQGRLLRP